MAGGYVAKFGDSIRRLAALDLAAQGDPNLSGGGPQPMTGAFDVAPQYQMRDPAREPVNGAFPEIPPAPGALPSGQGPQVQGGMSAPAQGPFGADANPQKLWDEMPSDARKRVIRQVERKGFDINKTYDEKVASGEITPPERVLSKGERLSVIAETMLRHARNAGSGQSGGAASGNAILETQSRRGGLEQMAAEKEAATKEMLRQEGRSDTKDATTRTQKVEDDTRKYRQEEKQSVREREFKREEAAAKVTADIDTREDEQTQERELSRAELAARRAQEKGKNVQTFTAEDGTVVLIDKDSNKVIPLEVETEETTVERGTRGRKFETTKKVKKPLKGIPTNAAGGTATLDPDTIANRKAEFEDALQKGEYERAIKKQMRAAGLTREEVIAQMRQQALGGAESSAGSKDDPYNLLGE